MWARLIVGGFFALLVIGICGRLLEDTPNGLTPSNRAAPRTAAQPSTPPLELLSWNWSREHDYAKVEGEVRNASARPLKSIAAVATFRTDDGVFVASDSALIDYNPLMPGQTSPFSVIWRYNPVATKASVAFKELMGGKVPHADLSR
jgi:hypothetical protein